MKEPVYIIIPVHNRKQITLSCLENLRKNGDLDRYHTVIIDDGSTDGTTEAINKKYPNVTILPGDGNLWWTGAMALGMQYADEQGAEYFIWLNDDCLPDCDTLPKLIDYLKNNPNAIAAPTCYAQEDNLLVKKYNGARGRKACAADFGEVIEVDSMSGWCVAISAAVVRGIGVPDAKKFPHYCGDNMYILKANRSGFKAYLVGDTKATLFGTVREKYRIQNFFKTGLNFNEIINSIFRNKKSPYRLSTCFFVFIERNGIIWGLLLFILKQISWNLQIIYFYIQLRIKHIFIY